MSRRLPPLYRIALYYQGEIVREIPGYMRESTATQFVESYNYMQRDTWPSARAERITGDQVLALEAGVSAGMALLSPRMPY